MKKIENIRLRALKETDIWMLYSWINDAEVIQYTNSYRPISEMEQKEWFYNTAFFRNNYVFGIEHMEDKQLVGTCGLYEIDTIAQKAELRMKIGDKSYRGLGLGYESLHKLLSFGFNDANLNKIWLKVLISNTAAVKLYEKTGFALGIDNSAAHSEIKLCSNGFKVVEVGARLGGDFISSYLTEASTGVSMDKAAIQIALGFKPDIEQKWDKHSMIQYIEFPIGKKVKQILPIDDILHEPEVVFAHIFLQKEDVIKQIQHSAVRPACVIVNAVNRNKLLETTFYFSAKLMDKIQFN
jgi:RimJ/RimL family protein N-acetyltransferase